MDSVLASLSHNQNDALAPINGGMSSHTDRPPAPARSFVFSPDGNCLICTLKHHICLYRSMSCPVSQDNNQDDYIYHYIFLIPTRGITTKFQTPILFIDLLAIARYSSTLGLCSHEHVSAGRESPPKYKSTSTS